MRAATFPEHMLEKKIQQAAVVEGRHVVNQVGKSKYVVFRKSSSTQK